MSARVLYIRVDVHEKKSQVEDKENGLSNTRRYEDISRWWISR